MSHPYAEIPELNRQAASVSLIRIPMEQDVPFTPRVRAIVDTAEFRRLAEVSQLGLASRVYPGATHTRFEHALGVFHNATRYLLQLGRDERFRAAVDCHMAEVLLVAALLHDLGHWPFCHPIEDMKLPDLPPHEAFAAEFLAEGSELATVLRTAWQVEPTEVLDVLTGRDGSAGMRLLRSILSGPIDIDKMDYLDRDSLHCGVPYGRNFDRNRLMQSLVVNQAGDGLAIRDKGRTAAELMVFARYVMFSEVYWHHAVRSATAMFARGFHELYQRLDLGELFRSTEADMIRQLRSAAEGTVAERLMEGVFGPRRVLDKRIAEYSHSHSPALYSLLAGRPYPWLLQCAERLAERLSSRLQTEVAATDVLIDAPPPDREVEFKVEICFPREGDYRPLREVSPVVDALARKQFDDYVKQVRIFARPELTGQLRSMEDFGQLLETVVAEVDAENAAAADG